MAERCIEGAACGTSRRVLVKRLLALALVLPVAACAERRAAPVSRPGDCIAKLRRMGQMSAKPGGRCN